MGCKIKEETVHKEFVETIKWKYPYLLFRTDGGGLRLPIGLRVKYNNLQCCKGWPDIFFAYPYGGFHGLFMEIKTSRNKVYTKKGEVRSDEHNQDQYAILLSLRDLGYAAEYGFGVIHSLEVLEEYLNGNIRY